MNPEFNWHVLSGDIEFRHEVRDRAFEVLEKEIANNAEPVRVNVTTSMGYKPDSVCERFRTEILGIKPAHFTDFKFDIDAYDIEKKPHTIDEVGDMLKQEREKENMINYGVFHGIRKSLSIKDVKFNGPATIVLWEDGTKTIVKCGKDDTLDPEKGLAMAIVKKVYGNHGNYFNVFRKYVYKEKKNNIPLMLKDAIFKLIYGKGSNNG